MDGILGYFPRMRVFVSDSVVDKVPTRKNKKQRIQKKWIKRYGWKFIPSQSVFIAGDLILIHPKMVSKFEKHFELENKNDL